MRAVSTITEDSAVEDGIAQDGTLRGVVPTGGTGVAEAPVPGTTTPRLVTTVAGLRAARADLPGPVALVATMGALHAGHAALIRAARARAASVVVTVFVNPLQFGEPADLERYPRTLPADLELAGRNGADLVFAPSADEMYPAGRPLVSLSAGELGRRFEGAARPGHFDGVLTVVSKLFHLVQPDLAFFGYKDAQQVAIVRRMVADLNMPVEIVPVPIVRDDDGVALSSRNRFLSGPDRTRARALHRALAAAARADGGPAAMIAAGRAVLDEAGVEPDYLVAVDEATLDDLGTAPADPDAHGRGLLLVAARFGDTRLIDAEPVELG